MLAGRGADAVRSFGRGYDARVSLGHASLIFEHQVADPTRMMGVMDHFWTTGSSEEEQAEQGVHLMIFRIILSVLSSPDTGHPWTGRRKARGILAF